jgi:hypothetical protein
MTTKDDTMTSAAAAATQGATTSPATAPGSPASAAAPAGVSTLPGWARELIALYESGASNQFILYGNVGDRMVLPLGAQAGLGNLDDFLLRVLLPRFDVILTYDLGNGVRVEKGEKIFAQWPYYKENPKLPRAPRNAYELLTFYFRYVANLARIQAGEKPPHIALIIKTADLAAPALAGAYDFDVSAMVMQIRDWSVDSMMTELPLAVFLITENLADLHPLLVGNTRAAQVRLPLPSPADLAEAFRLLAPAYPTALAEYAGKLEEPAGQLAGATLGAIEAMLKTREHAREKICAEDLVKLKKQLVEKDCGGLIEFIESGQTLEDYSGQARVKEWVRQDIALWNKNDLQALPMGYLVCGPVGTGKTYMVRCLAGEAGVPVVRFKNFRDKWVGSTEGNLEKIFRLIHALGRCIVFIDEADQALGKRDSGAGDSGVSGRIYSMFAEEMSDTRNRGKILWVLASSRPDLIEVDLKRPGRVDVKIPLFPTSTPEEGFKLIGSLAKRRGIEIPEAEFEGLKAKIPLLLTPGAAEALAVKIYRIFKTQNRPPVEILKECLESYQNPVPADVLKAQIRLAVNEASDLDFVPAAFREKS